MQSQPPSQSDLESVGAVARRVFFFLRPNGRAALGSRLARAAFEYRRQSGPWTLLARRGRSRVCVSAGAGHGSGPGGPAAADLGNILRRTRSATPCRVASVHAGARYFGISQARGRIRSRRALFRSVVRDRVDLAGPGGSSPSCRSAAGRRTAQADHGRGYLAAADRISGSWDPVDVLFADDNQFSRMADLAAAVISHMGDRRQARLRSSAASAAPPS